jgi:hypothetical protein
VPLLKIVKTVKSSYKSHQGHKVRKNLDLCFKVFTVCSTCFNYAFEKPTKYFIQELVIDTEYAIRQRHENKQNIYRFLSCNIIKQTQNTTSTNTLYKRKNYVTNQIRKKFELNNLTVT